METKKKNIETCFQLSKKDKEQLKAELFPGDLRGTDGSRAGLLTDLEKKDYVL